MSNSINQPPRRYARSGMYLLLLLFTAFSLIVVFMEALGVLYSAIHGDYSIPHITPIFVLFLSLIVSYGVIFDQLFLQAKSCVHGDKPNV